MGPKIGSTRGISPICQNVRLVELPKIVDQRGNLSFVEGGVHVPFEVRRVYFLYDVPAGSVRAGHAHHKLQQLIIAASGSFDLHLDDGYRQEVITLNRPHQGILMGSMIWRELHNFSSGGFCLVLASERYDEADYIREYDDFLAAARS